MLRFKTLLVLILLIISSFAYSMQTVQHINLDKYLGKWYEIARFDSWFEAGCVNATAEYSKNDSIIKVVNTCHLNSPNGKLKSAIGRAWVNDASNAKLKVSFLPRGLRFLDRLFAGDYWILKIDTEYSVVLVGEPSKEYLWILARTPVIEPQIYNEYVAYAKQLGFDIKKLHLTYQEPE